MLVSVLKNDEGGTGAVVVRGYETSGRPADVTIELPFLGREISTSFGPHEVKTILVPAAIDAAPAEVDLLEWDPAVPSDTYVKAR